MRLNIDVALHYRFPRPNTVLVALEAAHADGQTILNEELHLGDAEVHRIAGDAGVGERIWARVPGNEMMLTYRALVDITRPDTALDARHAAPHSGLCGALSAPLAVLPVRQIRHLRGQEVRRA